MTGARTCGWGIVKRRIFAIGAVVGTLATVSCSGPQSYFPLEVGESWTYNVLAVPATYVEEVKVLRRVAVADTEGYELGGPLGYSRVAWKGGVLVADSLPNTRVAPPLPLLVPGDPNTVLEVDVPKKGADSRPVRTWKGYVETLGKRVPAKAALFQQEETLKVGSRKVQTIKATVRLYVEGKILQLESWYADGMGPVRQEQRVGRVLNLSMEFIASP